MSGVEMIPNIMTSTPLAIIFNPTAYIFSTLLSQALSLEEPIADWDYEWFLILGLSEEESKRVIPTEYSLPSLNFSE